MRKQITRANATEINKTPNEVRYLWVVYPKSTINRAVPSVCMTYQTLSKVETQHVQEFLAVDLKRKKVVNLPPGSVPIVAEEWRDNYFDPDWELPDHYYGREVKT